MRRVFEIAVLVLLATNPSWNTAAAQKPPYPDTLPPPPINPEPVQLPPISGEVKQDVPAAPSFRKEREPFSDPRLETNSIPSMGRQDSALSVEWTGPAVAHLGQPTDYTLVVRNTSNGPVHEVKLNVRLVTGMTITSTEPPATPEGDLLVWQIGTLLPKQTKNVQLRFAVDKKKDIAPRASVSFVSGSSSVLGIRVDEPKLTLKATGPAKIVVGDTASFVLAVSNQGDGMAEQVKIHAALPEGLEHPRGKQVDFEVGNLSPGEARSVQLVCTARGDGVQKCEVVAEALGGIRAQEVTTLMILTPTLSVQATGPGLCFVDRRAKFTVLATNRGDIPAGNVTISEAIPAGFKFVSATDGGNHDGATRTISWFLGELAPGQAREVKFELVALGAGEHKHKIAACTERGVKSQVERELITRVDDLSELLLEVADTDDPVAVGKDTTYEIQVTNSGSKTEPDVKVTCVIPEKMELKSVEGPTRYHVEGKVIAFEPLAKLAARSDVVYRIKVRALAPGDVRFKTQVSSTNLVEPVMKMEATRIYADQP